MAKKQKKKPFLLITIIIIVSLFLFLKLSKSSELKALENSASKMQLTKGKRVSYWQQDKGSTLGKPHYAGVRIEYEPVDGYTLDDVYNETISSLTNNGWEKDAAGVPQTGFYVATLAKDHFVMEASVLIIPERKIVNLKFR